MTFKEKLVDFLEKNRGLVVLLFCLPCSFIFDFLMQIRKKTRRFLFSRPEKHDVRVLKIQNEIKKWSNQLTPKKKLCTSRPNWLSLSTCFFPKDKCHQITIDLFDILELNEENLTVRVEPMVTVGDITEFLIPKGYTLAVTLEISDATLGGLALAAGMTTHSHKVGLYHNSIVSYEILLSDGSLVKASQNENEDLYKCLPWSHGSLGFLVGLTLKIEKIKPYIKLNYTPVKGQKEYCNMIRMLSGDISADFPTADYIEATIYSKDEAVIMTGNYSDFDPNLQINHCNRWYKPWFYKYTETFLNYGKHCELIPLQDYLLRHNRAIFWVVESMLPYGNHFLFRLLFGWLLPPKPAFLKFTTTPGVREYTFTKQVFQDIVLPIRKLEEQIELSGKLFDAYPLLVYPCKVYKTEGLIKPPKNEYIVDGTNYAIYNDLGIYGVPGFVKNGLNYNPVDAMRKMERFTIEIGGFSFLYADIFMTENELREMFDLELYEKVRKFYKADGAFPHLYEKVKPEIDVFKYGKCNLKNE